jgi:hypothetical protein
MTPIKQEVEWIDRKLVDKSRLTSNLIENNKATTLVLGKVHIGRLNTGDMNPFPYLQKDKKNILTNEESVQKVNE